MTIREITKYHVQQMQEWFDKIEDLYIITIFTNDKGEQREVTNVYDIFSFSEHMWRKKEQEKIATNEDIVVLVTIAVGDNGPYTNESFKEIVLKRDDTLLSNLYGQVKKTYGKFLIEHSDKHIGPFPIPEEEFLKAADELPMRRFETEKEVEAILQGEKRFVYSLFKTTDFYAVSTTRAEKQGDDNVKFLYYSLNDPELFDLIYTIWHS